MLTTYKYLFERSFLCRIYGVNKLNFNSTDDYAILEQVSSVERATAIILILSTILVFLYSGVEYLTSKKKVYLVGLIMSFVVSLIVTYGLIPFWNGIM